MKYSLVVYPHQLLRTQTVEVENITHKSTQTLLIQMEEILKDSQGVGIAAPQVNSNLSCFLVYYEDTITTFINPKILDYSISTDVHEEGCLSIPGVFADVVRPQGVIVEAYNPKGEKFQLEAEGFYARIIQHEFDHLSGVLFIDHLSRGSKRRIMKLYEKLQKNKIEEHYN